MPSYSRKIAVPGKTSQELYEGVSQKIDHFLGKIPMGGKIDLQRDEIKKEFRMKSSLFSATLSCQEGALSLEGQLSLFAAPFRAQLDEGVEKWVAKLFQNKTLS